MKINSSMTEDIPSIIYLNDLGYASQQRNLVYNHDFRLFSNKLEPITTYDNYKHPDGYIYTDSGTDGKIGYDTSSECCKFQTSSDGSGARILKQALHEVPKWGKLLKGSTVTLKAFVKGANATVKLTDGVTVQSFALQNTGAVEEVTLQLAVSSSATELTFSVESTTASNMIEIYKVYANRGLYAIETLPCIVEGLIGDWLIFSSDRTPTGTLYNNGAAPSRATYSRLFSVIQTKYGTGDGSTTFNLPNGQAVVLKGIGSQVINTRTKTGPAFAAVEEDRMENHYHTGAVSYITPGYGLSSGGTVYMYGGGAVFGISTGRSGDTTRENSIGSCFYIKYA